MAGSGFSFGTLGLISTGVSTLFNAFGAKSVMKYNNAIAQAQADIAKDQRGHDELALSAEIVRR